MPNPLTPSPHALPGRWGHDRYARLPGSWHCSRRCRTMSRPATVASSPPEYWAVRHVLGDPPGDSRPSASVGVEAKIIDWLPTDLRVALPRRVWTFFAAPPGAPRGRRRRVLPDLLYLQFKSRVLMRGVLELRPPTSWLARRAPRCVQHQAGGRQRFVGRQV